MVNTTQVRPGLRTAVAVSILPLLGLLAGLGAAAAVTTYISPTYDASASVIVMPSPETGRSDVMLTDGSLAQNLVASVAGLVNSRQVTQVTAGTMGLPEDQVSGHITGLAEPGIQIVTINTTADSAAEAAAMADTAAAATITLCSQLQLGGTAVVVQALDRAVISAEPVSPKPLLNYALGGFVGLLVGIAFGSLRRRVDDRFRSVATIETDLGLPAFGVIGKRIPRRKAVSARSLYARADVGSSIDGLVSALSVLGAQRPGRRVVVTSVGDEDSTAFVASLLSVGLLHQNSGTTLLEGHWRRPVVQRYFPGHVQQSVEEILAQRELPDPTDESTTPAVLTADAVRDYFAPHPRTEQVGALVDALSANGDYVVVTAPPVLAGSGLTALAQHADVVILIVASDRVRKADAGRAALLVQRLGVPVAGVVVMGSATHDDGWQPATWPSTALSKRTMPLAPAVIDEATGPANPQD